MNRSKFFFLIAIGCAVIALCVGLIRGYGMHSRAKDEPDPITVESDSKLKLNSEAVKHLKLDQAALVEFPEYLNIMGRISPTEDRTTTVPARVGGRIQEVAVASGETVVAGQILLKMFSPDFIAAKEEYFQSVKRSHPGGESTDSDDFGRLADLARKKLETMGLTQVDINSDLLVVRAPGSGALATKNATVGSLVTAGDVLFTIANLSHVWFLGDLYPEDLPKVRKNQEIYIQSTASSESMKGKVSFISPFVDPSARTIKIRAVIENPKLLLRADMYVQGKIVVNRSRALVIPTPSIIRVADNDFVFVQLGGSALEGNAGGIEVQRVLVKSGLQNGGFTAIENGLRSGDRVVSDGALILEGALEASGT